MREQDKLIANIGKRLNQMDSLVPSLSLISDRMASIEVLLKAITELMQQGRQERNAPPRKVGSGKDH